MLKFKIGDIVGTFKGSRYSGPFIGEVVGFTTWKDYKAVRVKKENGKIVTCLLKNLYLFQEDIYNEHTLSIVDDDTIFDCEIPKDYNKNLDEFKSKPVTVTPKIGIKLFINNIIRWFNSI